jgi:FkbM family methyltransferase
VKKRAGPFGAKLRRAAGLLRSLWLYRRPGRQQPLREFYRAWIEPGAVVFDVGAHVGDRSLAFAALGARVIAVEPQPHLASFLRRTVARDPRITVVEAALGARNGRAKMAISRLTPTVSSLDETWTTAVARHNAGFARVRWDEHAWVEMTTLDELIARYGEPAFCKIDVEGFEREVLAGLSRPIRTLSLEFVHGALGSACACLERLQQLGDYEFNATAAEGRAMLWGEWLSDVAVRHWLEEGADGLASGDLHARLQGARGLADGRATLGP